MATKKWTLAAALVTLGKQVDKAKPKRDKRSDGTIGDAAHAARKSEHNPNARGFVNARDFDEDVVPGNEKASETWMRRLTREIAQYAASGLPGSNRPQYVIYEQEIASGTYKKTFWKFRNEKRGHTEYAHVTVTRAGETDGRPWPLPIFGYPSFAEQKAALAKAKKAPVKKAVAKTAAKPKAKTPAKK